MIGTDAERVAFLQWALPRLHMRWPGFRRVRGQVCKRITRRLRELELSGLDEYKQHLLSDPAEWGRLDRMCRVTVSRFYRDRGVFDFLSERVLVELAELALRRGEEVLAVWSAGCASGEEPYSLAMVWRFALADRYPGLSLRIVASDADGRLIARAAEAIYTASSFRGLPEGWIERGFERAGGRFLIRPGLREGIELLEQDLRGARPAGPFHMVLCRNLVFTYFDESLQRELITAFSEALIPGGALVTGIHESIPAAEELEPWDANLGVHRRKGAGSDF